MMKRTAAYGLGRNRDRVGKVASVHLNPYVNCIHTLVGGGWKTMQVLVVEIYEDDRGKDNGNTRA